MAEVGILGVEEEQGNQGEPAFVKGKGGARFTGNMQGEMCEKEQMSSGRWRGSAWTRR